MTRGLAGVAAILLASGGALPPKTDASGRVPQFENSEVRVWKSIVAPNAPLSMHRHDHPRVIIALKGGEMNMMMKSGGSDINRWETGKAYWLAAMKPGEMHADVNVGKEPIEVMVVELKNEK